MRSLLVVVLTATALAVTAAPAAAQPACGDVITEDTMLTADLDCSAGDQGLIVGADGITLDLGGHSVVSHGEAIVNEGHDGVTIRNGSVYSTEVSVELIGVTGNTVRDLDVDALVWGIVLRDSDDNRVVGNRLISAVLSISQGSERNVVRDNSLRGREGVIALREASENRIVHNSVSTGTDNPISMGNSHRNVIRHNTLVVTGAGFGLGMFASDDNLVAHNSFVHSGVTGDPGARLNASSRNVFRANSFTGVSSGPEVLSGADNLFASNSLVGDPLPMTPFEKDGFRVHADATGTVLRNNAVQGFADDGIDVEAPGTLIRRNTANDNGDLGIEAVAGVIDGGGNSASGNGNPLQCAGVACGP